MFEKCWRKQRVGIHEVVIAGFGMQRTQSLRVPCSARWHMTMQQYGEEA